MKLSFLSESQTDFTFTDVWVFPFFFILLLVVELFCARKMKVSSGKNFLKFFALTHLPWFFLLAGPAILSARLPAPHDFPLRKIEILFGLVWVTHCFLFARLLLASSYKKGLRNSAIFGFVSVFLFFGAALWTGSVCEPSGDEPHYLLMAQSLIHDGDLDLSNNYQNKDYLSFYHRGDLEPQGLEHVVEGRRYSHHPLGPVLLVLPGFLIAGRLGAAMTMALIATLALFLSLKSLEETGAKGWALHATGIIGLFSSPILLFSGLIFPEIPTACLAALALLLYVRKNWLWLGVSLGLMLWMHNRNVLIVAPFLVIAAWEIWKNRKPNPAPSRQDAKGNNWVKSIGKLLGGFAVPVAALSAYFYHIYGVLTPLGAHNEPFTSLFSLSHFWIGFFGLIFDQECGFCFHYPVFAMGLSGGVLLYQSRNPLRLVALGVFTFYFLFMSFYENLGLTPTSRYFVGIIPFLLVMIYPMLEATKAKSFGYYSTLFAFATGALVNWILAAVPWMRYNKLNGENWILKIAGDLLHVNMTAGAPSFMVNPIAWQSYAISVFWWVVTLIFTVHFLKHQQIKAKNN